MNPASRFRFLLLAVCLFSLRLATSSGAPSDSLTRIASCEGALILNEDQLEDRDYEEFADWLSLLPGVYPLDRAGYYQPFRMQFMGLDPRYIRVTFRGREMTDHLLGSPESQWISPGSVRRLRFDPFPAGSAGAEVSAEAQLFQPEPPSSRVAVRDGYYGTGFVDFNLAEYITPAWMLNGGGRVSNSDGRMSNSAAYGLNLRAEVIWMDSARVGPDTSGVWGWWSITQNTRKSEVPYQDYDHNTFRYESDAVLHFRNHSVRVYGIQQRETYHHLEDAWDELGVILRTALEKPAYGVGFQLRGAQADWRLNNTPRSITTFGGADLTVRWRMTDFLRIRSHAGLDLSDDFDPAPNFTIRLDGSLTPATSLFAGAAHYQHQPTRFQTTADFSPGEHFLPYDPAFYQYPDLPIQGNPGLGNETVQSIFAGCRLDATILTGVLGYLSYRLDDPIRWREREDRVQAYNAAAEQASGAIGWFTFRPAGFLEIGGTGSYLPLEAGQQRLFPEVTGHTWIQLRHLFAGGNLDMRLRFWGDFWGQRWFPVEAGWEKIPDDFVLSGRISARLYGFRIYWGVNNIFDRDYALLPGYPMMHKEEVWGIAWNFRD